MSGTTLIRGLTVLVALAASACATNPEVPTTQFLLDSMSAPGAATLASCQAANMALVCRGNFRDRFPDRTASSLKERCACADLETR